MNTIQHNISIIIQSSVGHLPSTLKLRLLNLISLIVKFKNNSRKKVELIVTDERNTLDRCMLHFAYFHTAVEPIEGTNQYRVHIEYDNEDLSEMVIRVLMFGPYVEVTNPPEFRQAVVAKLEQQYRLRQNNI